MKETHDINSRLTLVKIVLVSQHKNNQTNLCQDLLTIGPLQDPVTWYGINYTGTQITQWDFQNKRALTNPVRLSFVLEVPLRHLRPSVIYSVPCDRIRKGPIENADWDLKVHALHYANELLVLDYQELLQTRQTSRNNKKLCRKGFWL